MNDIFPLDNDALHYDWGSPTAIPDLMGKRASGEPMAELWLGAHPKASSRVEIDGRPTPLNRLIAEAPELWLGAQTRSRFGDQLPFLLKILAADKPLSIQAHPDLQQAAAGFEREQALGLELSDPKRNYRDRNHKPEIIYALTPFTVLCGFREPDDILGGLELFGLDALLPEASRLAQGVEGLKSFFSAVLTLDSDRLQRILAQAFEKAGSLPDDARARWILRLAETFPDDRGILAPLFLNLATLEPGRAMYTGPGILHAYLDGLGIELMAGSDNVLRGGCTSKHVDVQGLIEIVRFAPHAPQLIEPLRPAPEVELFICPTDDIELSRLTVGSAGWRVVPALGFPSPSRAPSPQILLCTEGQGVLSYSKTGFRIPFQRGDSFVIPAAAEPAAVEGQAVLFLARTGLR